MSDSASPVVLSEARALPAHPAAPPPGAEPVADSAAGFVEVARVEQIPPGWAMTVRAGARLLAVANRDGELTAVENICTHAAGPLGDSRLKDGCLVCPWHDSAFDSVSGEVTRGPARKPVRTYPVQVKDGVVLVRLDPAPTA